MQIPNTLFKYSAVIIPKLAQKSSLKIATQFAISEQRVVRDKSMGATVWLAQQCEADTNGPLWDKPDSATRPAK